MKTLDEQIACARRELARRRSYYQLVNFREPQSQEEDEILAEAVHEIECLQAIIETLEMLAKGEKRCKP